MQGPGQDPNSNESAIRKEQEGRKDEEKKKGGAPLDIEQTLIMITKHSSHNQTTPQSHQSVMMGSTIYRSYIHTSLAFHGVQKLNGTKCVHIDQPNVSPSPLIIVSCGTDVSVLILFAAPLDCSNTLEINY